MKAYILNGDEQQQKLLVQANISFLDLYRNATFTFMRDPIYDPYDLTDVEPRNEFYQRRTDPKRVKEIAAYIRRTVLYQYEGERVATLFPTAMLVAASLEDISYKVGDTVDIDMNTLNENSIYIVDGQHRLMGMIALFEELQKQAYSEENRYLLEYLKRFMFNCTIMLNFDLWEQAQVFADVNFNQKKVDKSLYYTIYGMKYSDNPADYKQNYIYIAHSLVRFMNTYSLSPLKGMVMMVGNQPGYTKALMSQACLAESLMTNIYSRRGIWYVDQHQLIEKPNYRYMSVELLSFYTCIRDVFPDMWPTNTEHRSILLKTTGIWAMNKLMAYLHKYKMSDDLQAKLRNAQKNELLQEYADFVKPILQKLVPMQDSLFSLSGNFARTGGKGLAKQLFDRMIDIIDNEQDTDDMLVSEEKIDIIGERIGVKIYKTVDGYYYFTLSDYFQNSDQMSPYIPGGGAIDTSIERIRKRLEDYKKQVHDDARKVRNNNF